MKYKLITLFTLCLAVLALSACNQNAPQERSENQKRSEAYVEEVAKRGEYKELRFLNEEHPIYYKVLAEGENKELYPIANSTVQITLRGWLVSGQEFQKSTEMTTEMEQLVPGVKIALQNMNVGDRWEVVIPWQQGYGAYSRSIIPGFSALNFDITLDAVVKQ